jgi:AcrR family transcriptional regulator
MGDVNPHRKPYTSPSRSGQLDATRRRILDAARARFGQRGYASATMAEIAAEAGLAVPTVYKNFGNKQLLLKALIDDTINSRVGPEIAAVMGSSTPRGRLQALAGMTVHLGSAAADVVSIAMGASGADPEFARIADAMSESRRANAARIASALAADDALAEGCSEEMARDVLWALASPDLFEQLVARSGWSPAAFEHWLGDALVAVVLRPDAR